MVCVRVVYVDDFTTVFLLPYVCVYVWCQCEHDVVWCVFVLCMLMTSRVFLLMCACVCVCVCVSVCMMWYGVCACMLMTSRVFLLPYVCVWWCVSVCMMCVRVVCG